MTELTDTLLVELAQLEAEVIEADTVLLECQITVRQREDRVERLKYAISILSGDVNTPGEHHGERRAGKK